MANGNAFPVQQTGLKKKIDDLEKRLDNTVDQLNSILKSINQQLSTTNDVVNALVEHAGQEEVRVILEAQRKAARDTFEAKQSAGVAMMKEKNILLPAETVTEESTVVTSEAYPDGKVLREQYVMAKVENHEAKAKFMGKKAGDVIDINGIRCELKEIFTFDKARADAVVKEETEKAAAAQKAMEVAKATAVANETPPTPEQPAEAPSKDV